MGPRPPRYPLEVLAELRDRKLDEAMGELVVAARQRDEAEQKRLAVEQKREAHSLAAGNTRSAEGNALDRGELRAVDLAHADAWETRTAVEDEALASELDRARADANRACVAEEGAREEVVSRTAEVQMVARDRARWREGQRKRADTKEEEASSEAWRPSKT